MPFFASNAQVHLTIEMNTYYVFVTNPNTLRLIRNTNSYYGVNFYEFDFVTHTHIGVSSGFDKNNQAEEPIRQNELQKYR